MLDNDTACFLTDEYAGEDPAVDGAAVNGATGSSSEEDFVVLDDTLNYPTRREYYAVQNNFQQMMYNLKSVPKTAQAKILRNSSGIIDHNVYNMMGDFESMQEFKLATSVIDYLKKHPCYTRDDRESFCSLIHGVCGNNLYDTEYFSWLCKRIGKKPHLVARRLEQYIATGMTIDETRGRKNLSYEEQQMIYDVWHENSIVTNDRRNGRDVVSMKKDDFKKYEHLELPRDIEIKSFISKRNQPMFKCTRRIYTKTMRQIHEIVKSKTGRDLSYGSVYNLTPFYTEKPREREKESCLCIFCLNLCLRFNELIRHVKDKEKKITSISTYYAHGITCEKGTNCFYQLYCISSACENEDCSLTEMFSNNMFDIPNAVKFYQFVREKYTFKNKQEVEKTGQRTVRKEFVEEFVQFKEGFDSNRDSYLLHRYECINDNYMWPQIMDQSELGYIFHIDFSENISVTPKYEPQAAHFSGKQTSLHCTVVYHPELPKPTYMYHISDNTTHNSVFTDHVIRDLIQKFNAEDYPLIRIKSDNCAAQYCSLHVFEAYQRLANVLVKTIIIYYGVNGHGKGLVDAMSGFGVKTPLRRGIITKDFMFNTAAELVVYLKNILKTTLLRGMT